MRSTLILAAVLLCTGGPAGASTSTELYTGTMEILQVSGKACAGLKGNHRVSLVLRREGPGAPLSGFFDGPAITTGRFSGSDQGRLDVRYPYFDEARAAGHFLGITLTDGGLVAELRDRHLDPSEDDCNFDLARMKLQRVGAGDRAESHLKPVAALYEAQTIRSRAFALARKGEYAAALPLYQQALEVADPVARNSPDLISPYLTGLANAFIKLGRLEDFNRLYDERIESIRDEGVRTIFTGHRIRSLLTAGKGALAAEDYQVALEKFRQAYRMQPQNREAVAAVMMTQLRMKEYDGAIAFLEGAQKSSPEEMHDLRGALAHVYFLRARKFDREGNLGAAEADLKKADTLDPYSVQYLVARARLLHKGGSLAEAEKLLQKGLERFQYEASRQEILAARDKMRLTETILKKIRKAGG